MKNQRQRPGQNTDSQGGSLGEILEHGEAVNQQIAGSTGLETKPDECAVCKKRFKGARGVRIHQAKSGCKAALGQDRVKKSKPVAGEFQESNHSDFSSNKVSPVRTSCAPSSYNLDTSSGNKSCETQQTLSQEVLCKIKELRRETEVLVIDDDNEAEIQSSILDTDRANRVENEKIEECL